MKLIDISYILTIAAEIILPIVLAIFIWKKFKVPFIFYFLGIIFFFISLIRIPLNNYLTGLSGKIFSGELFYILFGVISGSTAGIFEEGLRILAFIKIIKPRSYYRGVMYGLGQGGGGETMLFAGLTTLINYISIKFFPDFSPIDLLPQINSSTWYMPLTGSMEKIFTIVVQVAFSVLIMRALNFRRYFLIPLTVAFHIAFISVTYYLNYRLGIWYALLSIFVFAIAGICIIMFFKPQKHVYRINRLPEERK